MKIIDDIRSGQAVDSFRFVLVILPLVWLYAGMMWVPQGNKPLVPIVLLSLFGLLVLEGPKKLFENARRSPWFWVVSVSSIFSVISYEFHEYSSQELRALLIALFFLFLSGGEKVSLFNVQRLLLLSAMSSIVLSLVYGVYFDSGRGSLPTNAIPLATHQGFLALSLLGLLCVDFFGKNKSQLLIAIAFLFFSMLVTESRGPILGFILLSFFSISLFLISERLSRKTKSIVVLVSILAVFLGFDFLNARIEQTFIEFDRISQGDLDSSIGLRLQMYLAGWEVFKQYPMFGSGHIRWEDINNLGLTEPGMRFATQSHLHNNFIDKLAKSGLVGFSFLLLSFIYPLCYALRFSSKYFPIILYPVLFWFFVCLTDAPFRNGDTAVLYFISIGVFISAIKLELHNESTLLYKASGS